MRERKKNNFDFQFGEISPTSIAIKRIKSGFNIGLSPTFGILSLTFRQPFANLSSTFRQPAKRVGANEDRG